MIPRWLPVALLLIALVCCVGVVSAENMILKSNNFGSAPWSGVGISESDYIVIGPYNTTNGTRIGDTATTGLFYKTYSGGFFTYVVGTNYTFSIFVKQNPPNDVIQLTFPTTQFGTGQYANYNISQCLVLNNTGGYATNTTAPNGYCRIGWTAKAISNSTVGNSALIILTNNTNSLRTPTYTRTTANNLYIWGAQEEQSNYPNPYESTPYSGWPKVMLESDDGWLSNIKTVDPILATLGLNATAYVIPGYATDSTNGYMSLGNMTTLQSSGRWTIANHGMNHTNLLTVPPTLQQAIIQDGATWLSTNGFAGSNFFAYPYGGYNSTVLASIKNTTSKTGRTTVEGNAVVTPLSGDALFELNLISELLPTTDVTVTETYLSRTSINQTSIILFHVVSDVPGPDNISVANFTSLATYIKNNNITTIKMDDWYSLNQQYFPITATFTPSGPLITQVGQPVTFSDTSSGSPTAWDWSFTNVTGNNTPVHWSTAQNPTQTFGIGNFSIALNASSAAGSNVSAQATFINVSQPVPVVSFTATPTTGTAPLTVTLTDTSTNNPTAWNWSLGDGTFSTAQNLTHQYPNPGNYTVNLTATNSGGSNISANTYIVVNANIANIETDPAMQLVGHNQNVTFTLSVSGVPADATEINTDIYFNPQLVTVTNLVIDPSQPVGSSVVAVISNVTGEASIQYTNGGGAISGTLADIVFQSTNPVYSTSMINVMDSTFGNANYTLPFATNESSVITNLPLDSPANAKITNSFDKEGTIDKIYFWYKVPAYSYESNTNVTLNVWIDSVPVKSLPVSTGNSWYPVSIPVNGYSNGQHSLAFSIDAHGDGTGLQNYTYSLYLDDITYGNNWIGQNELGLTDLWNTAFSLMTVVIVILVFGVIFVMYRKWRQ